MVWTVFVNQIFSLAKFLNSSKTSKNDFGEDMVFWNQVWKVIEINMGNFI